MENSNSRVEPTTETAIAQNRLYYDGQRVRANWDGKLGTVRKLYREPFTFNESYQYYIDWDNGHWGIASESELSPVI